MWKGIFLGGMMRLLIVVSFAVCCMSPSYSRAENSTANAATIKAYLAMKSPQLTELAERGDVDAQAVLGARYMVGTRIIKQNVEEGLRLTRLAAERGSSLALYNLGFAYKNGDGVKADPKEAIKYLQLSAEKGYPSAQYLLGVMYLDGSGASKNYKESVKWSTLAAEQGHAGAQNNLGIMYREGAGVPKDFVAAYMWFNLALPAGDDITKENILGLESEMTPQQIEEAQRLTRAWKPKTPR